MVIILNISTNRKNHIEYFDAKIMIFLQKQSIRPAFLPFSLNFPTREWFVNFLKFIDLPQKHIKRNSHGGEKKWAVFCPNCHASPSIFLPTLPHSHADARFWVLIEDTKMKKSLRDNWDNWDNFFYALNSPKPRVRRMSQLVYIVNNQLVRWYSIMITLLFTA